MKSKKNKPYKSGASHQQTAQASMHHAAQTSPSHIQVNYPAPEKSASKTDVLERCSIEVDKARVEVIIRKEKEAARYELSIPQLSPATAALLNEIRNELVALTNISMKDLTDPEAFSAIKQRFINYANIIARRVGRQITVLTPLLDAHLITGDRINAVLYPVDTKGNTITIRKFARDPFTIIDFINNKTCDGDTASLIWLAMEYEMNVLISGGTGSGKTSFL